MCGWFEGQSPGGFGDLLSISNASNHYFGLEHAGDHLFVHLDTGVGGEQFQTVFNDTTIMNAWFFVAFVADSNGLIAYYHRDSGGSWTQITAISGVDGIVSTNFMGVGYDPALGNTGGTFDVCFVRAWGVALTASELQAERASTVPLKTSNLVFNNDLSSAANAHIDSTGTQNMTRTGTLTDSADGPTTPQAPAAGSAIWIPQPARLVRAGGIYRM